VAPAANTRINLIARSPHRLKPAADAPVDPARRWTPWDERSLAVPFRMGTGDREQGVKKVGSGEYRLAAAGGQPWTGARVQGESSPFDLELDGKRWEVKDVTSDNRLNVTCNSALSRFMEEIVGAVRDVEEFDSRLRRIPSEQARRLIVSGLRPSIIRGFIERCAPSIRNIEISQTIVRECERVVEMLGTHARSSSLLQAHVTVVFGDQCRIFEVPAAAVSGFMESVGIDDSCLSSEPSAALHHPWFHSPGSFMRSWRGSVKTSEAFSSAPDGLILVHEQKGYLHLRTDELDDWLELSQITRRMPKFKLRKVPGG
jgi:hypothetical protein